MPGLLLVETVEMVELNAGRFFASGEVEKDRGRGFPLELRRPQNDRGPPPGSVGKQFPQSLRVKAGPQRQTCQQERQCTLGGGADEQRIVEPRPLLEPKREPPRQRIGARAFVIIPEQNGGRHGDRSVGGGWGDSVAGDQIGAQRRGDGPGEAVRYLGGEVPLASSGSWKASAAAVGDQKRTRRRRDGWVGVARKLGEEAMLGRGAGEPMLLRPAQKQCEKAGSASAPPLSRTESRSEGSPTTERREAVVLVAGEVHGEGGAKLVLDVRDQAKEELGNGDALAVAEAKSLRQGQIRDRRRHTRARRREQLRRAVQLTPVRAHFGHCPCISRSGLKPR